MAKRGKALTRNSVGGVGAARSSHRRNPHFDTQENGIRTSDEQCPGEVQGLLG